MAVFDMFKFRKDKDLVFEEPVTSNTNYRSYVDAIMLAAMINEGDLEVSRLNKPAARQLVVELERTALELRDLLGEE